MLRVDLEIETDLTQSHYQTNYDTADYVLLNRTSRRMAIRALLEDM